ncbi:hypothetical protein, conserved [Eimeria maxima]|uniref:Uncharacterized protein n=1 Tax=Eimeria maxima TaxID=5804 RepID=U6M5M4_EIMMA|nr:hypothetical protein, conserved [Eimeria maxima]CDJ58368.1 hypothetical protein, conserved [Eimeria maxima]
MDKESDWCGPKRNSPVPLGPFVISTERVDATSQGYSGEGRSDIAVHTHPTEGTALLRGANILGRAAAQTVTGGVAFGVKRKTREDAITESTNKRFMVEDALEKFPPEPQPPMDPDLDSLIETLLSKQENVLFDHFFLLDDKQKNEMGDVLQDDSAQLNRDAANIPATPTHASAHTVASRATSTNKSLKGRTVSEKRSSQAATSLSLSYYESPKHSAALSPESWLLQYDDRIWGGEGTIQNTDNLLSRASNRPSSESQGSSTMVAESISQTLRHLPHGGQVPTNGVFQLPTTGKYAPSDQGIDTTLKERAEGSVAATTAEFNVVGPIAAENMPQNTPKATGKKEQSESSSPKQTVMGSMAAPEWFLEMYPQVPDELLQSHPFYFHPRSHGNFSSETLRKTVGASFRLLKKFPLSTLAEFRILLRKEQLSEHHYRRLLYATERLYGYATGSMPKLVPKTSIGGAVEVLGGAFIVVDTLYCAVQVLGGNSSSWWPDVINSIEEVRYVPRVRFSINNSIAEMLDVALNYYRNGARPPARVVVCLKEILLDSASSLKFSTMSWDLWRADAAEWREAMGLEVPEPGNL